MIESFAAVAVDDFRHIGLARKFPETRIAPVRRVIKWVLARQHKACARDERQATLGERLRQGRPWDWIDSSPRIRLQEEPYGQRKFVDVTHLFDFTSDLN